MSRTSRIPYHQNVYDLLQIELCESPETTRMIAEHEANHGPLPASVREWYLVPNGVPLRTVESKAMWFNAPGRHRPYSLFQVLVGFANATRFSEVYPYVPVLSQGVGGVGTWMIKLSESDDPQIVYDPDGIGYQGDFQNWSDTFSEFVAINIFSQQWFNDLWFRTPAEPFEPAVIDYLTDQFDEPERTPRPGNVTTYTFRLEDGIIRVTADEPTLGGGLSAWWVHADTPERLAELGRLIVPFGTLRETLRADTDAAREVLASLQK